ncbi:penicillin acylase family protein [Balneolaceae bacterium ANBcel3]|nr:penicillin acylase family protein [Balneolaceae bacterium ANBcel3]
MKFAVKIFFIFFLLLIGFVYISHYLTIRVLVPDSSADIKLEELRNTVHVAWDDFGVPTIRSQDELDMYTVLGYLHSRDRLWQMTLQQYRLLGLHSLHIDPALAAKDRFYISMGFSDRAQKMYHSLDVSDQRIINAYVNGINRFLMDHKKKLPIEFTLSDAKPVLWEPWHITGLYLLWKWDQNEAFWSKLSLLPVLQQNDPQLMEALLGIQDLPDTEERYIFEKSNQVLLELLDRFDTFSTVGRPSSAPYSNSGMAIPGTTSSDLPMLFINLGTPMKQYDLYYEILYDNGSQTTGGFTIPGIPVFFHGKNPSIAWSVSPLPGNDGAFFTGSLFKEETEGPFNWKTNVNLYDQLSDHIAPSRYILSSKDGSESFFVSFTSHDRPLVAYSEKDNVYIAYEWEPDSAALEISSMLSLHKATENENWTTVADSFRGQPLQILYTGKSGDAGIVTGGSVVNTTKDIQVSFLHSDPTNRIPVKNKYPSISRTSGSPVFLYESRTGNNDIFQKPWNRNRRLNMLVYNASEDQYGVYASKEWTNDTHSVFASDIVPKLSQIISRNPSELSSEYALPYFLNWNYTYSEQETAASLFELFLHKASRNLYKNLLSEKEWGHLLYSSQIPYGAVYRLIDTPLWPDFFESSKSEWITRSMDEAVQYLMEHVSEEPHDWQWGLVVEGDFSSAIFPETTKISYPARLAERFLFQKRSETVKGAPHTLFNAFYTISEDPQLITTSGTTAGFIGVFGDEPGFYSLLSSGQSGNFFSDLYDNQFLLWQQGEMRFKHLDAASVPEEQLFLPR